MKKKQYPQRSSFFKHLIGTLAAFLLGYFTATVFDFTSLSIWVNKNLLNYQPENSQPIQSAHLPKPKFEFYTLLSKDNTPPPPATHTTTEIPSATIASHAVAASKLENSSSVPATSFKNSKKETYLIQIASFNKRPDAETLKASLVLKGFDVNIAPSVQQNLTWYRVVIGPFNSHEEALKAQTTITQQEHMKGMIRKMNG